MVKELWLKVEDKQKYLEEEQRILHVLSEKEAKHADGYRVILYDVSTRSAKKLSRWVLVDEILINDLEGILGDNSVKVVQKEGQDEEVRRVYKSYIDEMSCISKADENICVELMKIQRLDRIAEALEGISENLEELNKLTDCIDTSLYGSRFCVTGGE